VREELRGSKEIIDAGGDREMIELAIEESRMLTQEVEALENELKILLMPKDPNDDKNIIIEVRAGAGGDEAGIFAGELFRMYTRYAERRGFRVELMNTSDATAGGFKEVIAMVTGEGAYSRFKYEAGVHRVQRVPKTETQGRVHTSTVTVVVLPEAEEVEVDIQDKDLRIDVYRSGGHGGQSVNTTDSAVRITHLPTNTVVAIQDEKSQLKNKDKAMKVLRARLYEMKKREADEAQRALTKGQIGSGDRSEKIRTYNFPQSRITDHRINVSVHNVEEVMAGELDDLVDQLTTHYQAEALRGETEQ
jgi:peptide chain release factor 1